MAVALPRPRVSWTQRVPPHAWFAGSAVFHYLGPAFAVLLFVRVEPLGVAWLRIAAAALVFAAWRRPWRLLSDRLLVAWGLVLALMNCTFYLAIDRLPLGTVAAIEFLPVVLLAALGARSPRNAAAVAVAVAGVACLADVRLAGAPLGFALAGANAALFALYIVLGHRVAQRGAGIDGLAAAMLVALVAVTPLAGWAAVSACGDPVALAAGLGVGICSSVIPYVCDQLAMARLTRAGYALLVALLPATATLIGIIVLGQMPAAGEIAGVALVMLGVALHREPA
jgi:inner membrane transporter RhtA